MIHRIFFLIITFTLASNVTCAQRNKKNSIIAYEKAQKIAHCYGLIQRLIDQQTAVEDIPSLNAHIYAILKSVDSSTLLYECKQQYHHAINEFISDQEREIYLTLFNYMLYVITRRIINFKPISSQSGFDACATPYKAFVKLQDKNILPWNLPLISNDVSKPTYDLIVEHLSGGKKNFETQAILKKITVIHALQIIAAKKMIDL